MTDFCKILIIIFSYRNVMTMTGKVEEAEDEEDLFEDTFQIESQVR